MNAEMSINAATENPDPETRSFEPNGDSRRAYRDALGRFGTGVTVVTCDSDHGPLGFTANSFASVSLDPPLVLWSPARASQRFDSFVTAQRFAIHVMSARQAEICSAFAHSAEGFDGFDWHQSAQGVPLISHCLARFECTRHAVHEGGDHAIVVGRVTRVMTQEGDPLLFYCGNYGGFT